MSTAITKLSKHRVTLDEWITSARGDTDKQGSLSMLSCVHMVGQNYGPEIHTVTFGAVNNSRSDKDLAKLFLDKAGAYAQDMPNVQTFCMLAFYGSDPEPKARHPFLVNNAPDNLGLFTEGPDLKGVLQQRMRHEETLGQMYMQGMSRLLSSYERTVDLLSQREAKLLRENLDMFEILQKVMMQKVTEDREFEMKRLQYERDTMAYKKWLSFGPALINQVLGREVFPQSVADTALVEAVADGLKAEDFSKLAALLPAELMGPLAGRMTEHLKKKREEEEEVKRLSAANGHLSLDEAENNAAGS